ncbi:MAG: SH3 domain-containing protein [Chloroflexi bacterium]|nr:SH3 domain-containing protein [Chloroflexota bacterium]
MRNLITWQLSAVIVLVLLIGGVALAPGAAAQSDNTPRLMVMIEALNVRNGPGTSYPVVGLLVEGDEVRLVGRHSVSGWWQVKLPDSRTGWVSGVPTYVQVHGDIASLPETGETTISIAPLADPPQTQPGLTGTIVFQTVSGGPIYAVNADGSNLRYLTTGIDPTLSPDGQWVAFTRWETNQNGALGNLWVINVDGSSERVIMDNVLQPKSPVWSPDGTQIAINMQHGGWIEPRENICSTSKPPKEAYDITSSPIKGGGRLFCYTLPADPYWGLRVVDVTTGAFEDLPRDDHSFSPAWDPANDWRIVYDGDLSLINLDLNLGTTWPLTGDVGDHSPAFSPDGSKIAVSYRQHDHWEIHVLNADGSGRVRLTETPWRVIGDQRLKGEEPRLWNNAAPAWSPDGSHLAFLTDRTGRWEIWVMNADGSNQGALFPAGTLDGLTLQYDGMDERALSWR